MISDDGLFPDSLLYAPIWLLCLSLTWVWGKGEPWGPLLGFSKASVPRRPGVWCSLGFAWLVWGFFVSPGGNLFGFFLCFSWAWRGCSSNPSAAFRGELDSSVLVQDQWEQAPGEELAGPGGREGLLLFGPRPGKKPEPGRESTPASPGDQHHRLTGFPSVCASCAWTFWFFSLRQELASSFSPPACWPLWVFILLWCFGFFFLRQRVRVLRSDNSISSLYLPFLLCCMGNLFVNKRLGFFTFIH